jgi:hypothetical protein
MLREILGVASDPAARRRWFHDDYFDLFVWQVSSGEVTSFQLCYGIDSSERALVWQDQRGFFHDGVRGQPDAGEVIGSALARGGPATSDPVIARFDAAAGALPNDVRAAVAARIREYVEKAPPVQARRESFRRADWQKRPAKISRPGRKPRGPKTR